MITQSTSGKACIAMLCAFSAIGGSASGGFAGSMMSVGLADDNSGSEMTLERYEQLFGLDLANPENATYWPSFVVSVIKTGGAWDSDLPAWSVPAGESGKLSLTVDRSLLHNVVLELEFYDTDAPDAAIYVDLLNDKGEVLISSESEGNLIAGSGVIVREAFCLPLENFPEAVGINIRATGELFLFEGLLYPAQEAFPGTGDLMVATDGDTATGGATASLAELGQAGRAVLSGRDAPPGRPRTAQPQASPRAPPRRGAVPTNGTNSPVFRATRLKSVTIPQWVMARMVGAQSMMSGANFVMSRNTLSGGGTRQTSPAFIMEDSIGQSFAIGFSYGRAYSS